MRLLGRTVLRGTAALAIVTTAVAPLAGVPGAKARPTRDDAFTFKGSQGATHTFALQGGRYVLDIYAGFFAATHPDARSCLFTASLNGVEHPITDGSSRLGSTIVGGFSPYHFIPTLNLPAGHYSLVVAPLTNCDWSVSIGGGGTGHPVLAFGDRGIYHTIGGSSAKTTIAETTGKPYTFGFAYNAWGDGFNAPTAGLTILQHGRVLHSYTLAPTAFSYGQTGFSVDRTFTHASSDPPGAYIARYSLTLGGKTATKDVPYTVQAIAPGHWSVQPAATPNDLSDIACPSAALCISPAMKGTVVGTADGSAWSARSLPLGSASFLNLYGAACPTVRTCYVVGEQYLILGSSDGGRTWVRQNQDYTFTSYGQNLIAISCPTERHCYAVGTGGIVVTTTDGGAHWSSLSSYGSGKDLTDVTCLTETMCYAVGKDGVIKITTNGGTLWQRRTVDTPYLFSINCPAIRVCYATGEQSTIVKTTDGGNTWTPQNNPLAGSSLWVDSVACSTTQRCHAVGQGGTLLLTTDGGQTWRDQPTPTDVQLNVVSCPNVATCYAVGSKGTVIKGA